MSIFPLKLIVGLGNPGDAYARTRHNAGFWFVDALARRHGASFRREPKHQGELARARIGSSELWLFKPLQYMNRSGGPTASVAGFYRISPSEMLVAHDELDLPVGVLRLKEGGGHGGHNGLRDLLGHFADGFWRLRIGVGHPGEKAEVVDFLTGMRPPADEERLLLEAIDAAVDAMPLLLEQGVQMAMNVLHSRRTA